MINKIYTNDWFGRSGEYVLKNEDLEIGFAKTPKNQYSQYLYDEHKAEQICSDMKLMMNEMSHMIRAIGLSNIRFKLSKNVETACTDGKFIYVGIGNNYKTINDIYEKLDRVIGMTIHECCHCLYTDFNYVKYSLKGKNQLIHHLHNVIEDEIIENKLCSLYPGYGNFLAKLKYNIFEKEYEKNNDNSELNKILEILFYLIRYPKLLANISEADFKKYESLFINIKKIMSDEKCFSISYKECTKSSINAAIKIYELLAEYIEENEVSGKSGNENNSLNDSNDSNDSNESEETDDIDTNEGINNILGETEDILNNSENKENELNNNSKENNDSDDDDMITPEIIENGDIEIENNTESTLDENGITNTMDSINENNITSTSESPFAEIIIVQHSDIEEKEETIEDKIEEWNDVKEKNRLDTSKIYDHNLEDKNIYQKYYNEIKSYIPITQKIIIPNNKNIEYKNEQYRRNGSLDPTRLANAMCNEQTVYTQKSFKISNNDPKYALVILLDESGSMEDMNINVFASKMAILFYESFKNYPNIQLFIYGHGDCIYRYIDPKHNNKYVLGHRRSQMSQNEIVTYNTVIEDVKSQTNLPIVVFNLTDSLYCSNGSDLKECVDNIINDKTRKISINLVVLRKNETHWGWCSSTINDDIYGKGHYIIYPHTLFKSSNEPIFISTLKSLSKIIIDNFNKRKLKNE